MHKNYSLLNFTSFLEIGKWSADYIVGDLFTNNLSSKARLSDVLVRQKDVVIVEDDVFYKRITIRQYGLGVLLRDEVKGIEIGTKRQFIAKKGQLIISRIDARNGSIGIVPKELDGAIVTNDFWLFDVRNANIYFLSLLLSSGKFQDYWQSKSNGTTNRQRVDETDFLNSEIYLPPLEEQNRIVEKHNQTISKADNLKQQAAELEDCIDEVLFKELGIQPIKEARDKSSKYKFMNLIPYSNVNERWEFDSRIASIMNNVNNGKYKVYPLGHKFNFVTRTWKKKNEERKEVKYIELGGIDTKLGIVETTYIKPEKAPSRATQIVREGDLVIGTTRPYLKKFAIVPSMLDNMVCSSGFQVIEKSSSYDLDYLIIILMSDLCIKQFEIVMTGALYPAINQEQLKNIKVPLPPLEIQKEIVKKIQTINDDIKTKNQRALELLQEAKRDFERSAFGETN